MVKDRLNELKQSHGARKQKTTETVIETENNNVTPEAGQNENKKLRQTFERANVIGQWIEGLEENNRNIRSDLRKLEDLNYNKKDNLQSLFQNNTSLGQQISSKIKELDEELGNVNAESTEGRIKTIQYTTLKTRFQNAFLENRKLLEEYKTTQKQIIKAQLLAKGYFSVTDDELTSLLDSGADLQVFTENILAETAEAKRILANVEERHQQLLQIERMLTEVRDLFVQMSILVDGQQELVDRIEYQVQAANDYICSVDLGAVRKSKKKYQRRKIYIIIAVVVVIILLLAILFH